MDNFGKELQGFGDFSNRHTVVCDSSLPAVCTCVLAFLCIGVCVCACMSGYKYACV